MDASAQGADDGSSWQDACNSLQDGLAVAVAGNEIRLAQGTYTPDRGMNQILGDRFTMFQLKNGVTIKGGYAGVSTQEPATRNVELYETILSGDPGDTVIDGTGLNDTVVWCINNEGSDTALRGFTNTGGDTDYGGGMFDYKSIPTESTSTTIE